MMRSLFQNPDAPFYFVQIAPWKSKHPENTTIPLFNEAQEKTLALIPNSGMAATVDIGEYGTIHPCRKKEVGDRLALLALTKTYGIQGAVVGSSSYKESVGLDAESPSYKEAVFVDGKAIVTMKVGKLGLSPIGQDLEGFELAGADGLFYPATGTVKDRYTLEVSSPDVPSPVAVRYCFHNWSRGTLYNCFGIPALPFRSDIWVLYYNKDIFDNAGVDYPTNDMTWEAYDQLARTVADNTPGEEIYGGQVVGEHTRERDLNINICKTKKLTNVRASGSDEKVILPPAVKFSLEEALEYIQEDELVEITPNHMRMRKILLDPLARKRNSPGED